MFVAILAALSSAVLHPFWAISARKAANPFSINFIGMVVAIILFSPLYFMGAFWEKTISNIELVLISSFLHVAYALLTLRLLSSHEFQVCYPLTRLAAVFVLLGEMLLLGQAFSGLQILGVILVCFGAIIFGFDSKITQVRWQVWGTILLITALVFGFHLVDKILINNGFTAFDMWGIALFNLPFLLWVPFSFGKEIRLDLRQPKYLVPYCFAMIGTWFLAATAMQVLPAAIVLSIRNLSIPFGVFLGGHFFAEGHHVKRYGAAFMICIGITLTVYGLL